MIDEIVAEMGSLFRNGVFSKKTSFRFTVDGTTITVILEAQSYTVEKQSTIAKADCSCKTSAEIFHKIWYDGYKPGLMDFFGGAIQTDQPFMLPQFLQAFGK